MLKIFLTYIVILFLGFITIKAQENYNVLIYKGNKNFDKKKYGEASSSFMEALKQKDKDFGAHYNLGNALYKDKKYEQAITEYQKAQHFTQNPDEKAASFYNQGNAHLQNGDTEKAVNSYKNALKYDPDNKAILKNLQIAKKKKREKENKQNNQGQQNQQNNQQNQQKNNQDQKGQQNQENKDQNTKRQNNGNKSVGKEGNQKQETPKNQSQEEDNKEKIPKDLQKLILQRSANQERETARKLLNKNGYYSPESNEKDW